MEKYPNKEITKQIIGAAYNVHNKLGYGFLEKVYHNALIIELEKTGLAVEKEKPLNVLYDGITVGEMLTQAQNDYINNVGKDFFTIEEFILLGDPSLKVGGYP